MAKSNPAPSFFKSAGDKLIRTRSFGKSNPELIIADRILSLASFTALSAKPTKSTAGIPRRKSTSTETILPSYPKGEKLTMCIFLRSRNTS